MVSKDKIVNKQFNYKIMKTVTLKKGLTSFKLNFSAGFKMKLTTLLLVVSFFKTQANTYSQDVKVTVDMEQVKLSDFFETIESLTEFRFIYNNNKIDGSLVVDAKFENTSLSEILKQTLSSKNITFETNEKYIMLSRVNADTTPVVEENIQRTINGTVSDNSGAPLPGATVVLEGTSTGATTDFDGNFTINANEGDVLVISFVGFETQQVTVGANDQINIVLEEGLLLEEVVMTGSRGKARSDVDSAVPVDVVSADVLIQTAQPEVAQGLHFTVPSFSAQKFGINDLAPLIDPATLRGLGSDQTLLLVNGKRRHKVAFFGANDGVGKGQLGNDMNAVPGAAIKAVEVLRDGAAAQYGSDAIAGVINYALNDASEGGSFSVFYGNTNTAPEYDGISNAGAEGDKIYGDDNVQDGHTITTSLNVGAKWGDEGFVNTTIYYSHADATDRSGTYSHSSGWYDTAQLTNSGLTNDQLLAQRGINSLDRAVLGTAENTNGGIFVNAGRPLNEKFDFYAFGGLQKKHIIGGVFSRSPNRTSRANTTIFPDGFNPEVPSDLTDFQITSGFKGDLGNDWTLDVSGTYSGQNLDLYARNTINPSLPDSPTQFYTGSLAVDQRVFNVDLVKTLSERTTLALGLETRNESYELSQGEADSWRFGGITGRDIGSSGREGFTPLSEGKWRRNNTGIYAEIDSDVTEDLLLTGAIRFEDYSDFGSDFSWKAAGRYKFTDNLSLRASANRSFRAPALAQTHYSNYSAIKFDGDGNSIFSPTLPAADQRYQDAFGIDNLKPETSFDLAAGLTGKFGAFTLTVDAYQIKVDDRLFIATVEGADYSQFAGFDEVDFFSNAINTKTTGYDIVAGYRKALSNKSYYDLQLAMNFNETEIESISTTPQLAGQISYDRINNGSDAFIYLTEGTPRSKIIFTPSYKTGKFKFTARVSNFGEVTEPRLRYNSDIDEWDDNPPGGGEPQVLSAKTVVDLTTRVDLTEKLSITASINNAFDVYPDMLREAQVRKEVIYSRRVNQFGTMGRFMSLSLNYNW